jgi:hypothetical protein
MTKLLLCDECDFLVKTEVYTSIQFNCGCSNNTSISSSETHYTSLPWYCKGKEKLTDPNKLPFSDTKVIGHTVACEVNSIFPDWRLDI